MLLDDILASAKQSLLERLASPLLGSFVIAWCAWNYRFLVILFSAAGVSETFSLVERLAFPDLTTVLTRGVLYPLLSALAYVFLYPYPARLVYAFTLRRQREINQTKQKIANETPLTLEESRSLRAEFVERERKHIEQVQRLNEEITRLNAALDGRPAQTEATQPPPPPQSEDRLEQTQIDLLALLEKIGSPTLESNLIQGTKLPRVKVEFDIGELERRKLLHRNYDQSESEYTLEFTHQGRKALLESKKPEA